MSREALFDLAVNRALSYALKLELPQNDLEGLCSGLEPWYLKTRFAYRIKLPRILEALEHYPGQGHYWTGGEAGYWQRGENPQP